MKIKEISEFVDGLDYSDANNFESLQIFDSEKLLEMLANAPTESNFKFLAGALLQKELNSLESLWQAKSLMATVQESISQLESGHVITCEECFRTANPDAVLESLTIGFLTDQCEVCGCDVGRENLHAVPR